MLPEQYLEELERSKKLKKIWKGLALSAVILTTFYFLAPLVHEASHILFLEFFDCSYSQAWSLSVSGLTGSIQPLCTLGDTALIGFYSIGYLSVILSGGVLGGLGIERHNSFLLDQLLTVTSIGFLLSLMVTIETKGDLKNILDLIGLDPVYGELVSVLVLFGASSITYLLFHNFLDQNGRASANGRL